MSQGFIALHCYNFYVSWRQWQKVKELGESNTG